MTSDDIKQIETVMDKKLTAMDKRLTAAEKRLKEEILNSGKRIRDDIGNFMEETLLPMFNERFDAVDERLDEKADKTDIDRIERKLDRMMDTSLDHEGRIKDIESIPVIAHELKRTKTR